MLRLLPVYLTWGISWQACETDYDVALVPGGIAEMMLPTGDGTKERLFVHPNVAPLLRYLPNLEVCVH